jgi:GcrA cell cycle regulator
MEWTDEIIGSLCTLWSEGHSTAEIGRRLGVSKNAVVGKAHRLNLPARPSPIRRDGSGSSRVRAPKRVSGPTLPPLQCAAPLPVAEPGSAAVQAAPERLAVASAFTASVTQPSSRPKPAITPDGRFFPRVMACSWPIGEPGTKQFRFCDAGSLPGKPYCEAHAAVAYVRVKDRREDAA